nr:hypothetical protein [Tanacetum cinerariifolium]
MVFAKKDPLTFNDLIATPINFSKYVLNRLNIDNLTQDLLLGHAYHLLKGKTYTTSITKTKAARYDIVGIEDMVPTLWSTIKHAYDKDATKEIKHQGERHKLCVKKLHRHGHLEEVMVKRADRQLHKFKEGDFIDLHLNVIEDMLLFVVQHKLFHLNKSDIVDFIVTFPEMEFKELDNPSYKPQGVIYKDMHKQKRVMRADELYKLSDRTLKKVRDELQHRLLDFCLDIMTRCQGESGRP